MARPAVAEDLAAKLIYVAHRDEANGALLLAAAVEIDALRAHRDRLAKENAEWNDVAGPFVRAYRLWACDRGEGYDTLIDLCEDVVERLERLL